MTIPSPPHLLCTGVSCTRGTTIFHSQLQSPVRHRTGKNGGPGDMHKHHTNMQHHTQCTRGALDRPRKKASPECAIDAGLQQYIRGPCKRGASVAVAPSYIRPSTHGISGAAVPVAPRCRPRRGGAGRGPLRGDAEWAVEGSAGTATASAGGGGLNDGLFQSPARLLSNNRRRWTARGGAIAGSPSRRSSEQSDRGALAALCCGYYWRSLEFTEVCCE